MNLRFRIATTPRVAWMKVVSLLVLGASAPAWSSPWPAARAPRASKIIMRTAGAAALWGAITLGYGLHSGAKSKQPLDSRIAQTPYALQRVAYPLLLPAVVGDRIVRGWETSFRSQYFDSPFLGPESVADAKDR